MAIIEDPEEHELAALTDHAPALVGARVLEVGSGSGRLTERYARRAASVIAIDPDTEAIEELKAHVPGVVAEAAAIESFALPDRSVDVVLFAWSL